MCDIISFFVMTIEEQQSANALKRKGRDAEKLNLMNEMGKLSLCLS